MLHRPTLMPKAMKTTSNNVRKKPKEKCEPYSSPFVSNEEVVVVEPTDPEEDRLKENMQQHKSMFLNPRTQTSGSAPHAPVSEPLKQPPVIIQPASNSLNGFPAVIPLTNVLQPFLNSIPTISSVPLESINKLNGITSCLLSNTVPTVWLQPPTATSVTTTAVTTESTPSVSLPQSTASLHPLVAAVLINCATVNMISQLTGSLGMPIYVPAPQGFIPMNNLTTVLPTLLANFPTNTTTTNSASSSTNVPVINPTCCTTTTTTNVPNHLPSDTSNQPIPASDLHSTSAINDESSRDPTPSSCSTKSHTEFRPRVKRFTCPMPNCSLTFHSRFHQTEHIRSHTGERPFICTVPDCSAAFSRCRDLHSHMNLHSLCDRELPVANVARRTDTKEVSVEGPNVCLASMVVDSPESVIRTQANSVTTNSPTQETSGSVGSERSDGTTTNSSKPRDQATCLQNSLTVKQCETNSLSVGRQLQRRYACPYIACDKAYFTLNKLKEHLRSHTGERHYVCRKPGCGASFIRIYNVRRHERTHGIGQNRLTPYRRFSEFPSVSNKFGGNASADKNHNVESEESSTPPATVEPTETKVIIKGMNPIPVLIYPKTIKPDHLMISNEMKLDKTSTTSSSVIPKRVLPIIAPKAPIPTTFRPLSPLSGTPGVRRPHICPFKECSKAFPKLNKLREHVCRHTGERPFVCDKCNASFVRMYDLQRHGKVHVRLAESRKQSRSLLPKIRAIDNSDNIQQLAISLKPDPESQDSLN